MAKTSDKPEVRIYSDGAAKSNPEGPGGFGTILEYEDSKGKMHVKELAVGYRKTTNNRMELMGVIAGMEELKLPCSVTVYTDSKYVADAFRRNWLDAWQKKGWRRSDKSPVKNVDLWKRLIKASEDHDVTYEWIKGHAGHPQNERCDEMASEAALRSNLAVDEVHEHGSA